MSSVLIAAVLLGLSLAPQVMAVAWAVCSWRNYYSAIDLVWTLLMLALAIAYSVALPGFTFRKVILVGLLLLWSLRLFVHLLLRLKSSFPKEDPRYQKLKDKWGIEAQKNFLVFFQIQGLAAMVLALPFWTYVLHPSPDIHWTEIVGIVLFLIALAGETVADEQLRRFRNKPENKGQTLQTGLWKYSRHPNYFCEWLIWVSLAIMTLSAPRASIALLSPAFMLISLLRWTGIPANEESSESNRGESYRRYRNATNAFFPWFPKKKTRTAAVGA